MCAFIKFNLVASQHQCLFSSFSCPLSFQCRFSTTLLKPSYGKHITLFDVHYWTLKTYTRILKMKEQFFRFCAFCIRKKVNPKKCRNYLKELCDRWHHFILEWCKLVWNTLFSHFHKTRKLATFASGITSHHSYLTELLLASVSPISFFTFSGRFDNLGRHCNAQLVRSIFGALPHNRELNLIGIGRHAQHAQFHIETRYYRYSRDQPVQLNCHKLSVSQQNWDLWKKTVGKFNTKAPFFGMSFVESTIHQDSYRDRDSYWQYVLKKDSLISFDTSVAS